MEDSKPLTYQGFRLSDYVIRSSELGVSIGPAIRLIESVLFPSKPSMPAESTTYSPSGSFKVGR